MVKYLKNNRGSTLLMTLMIMVVLSILGSAIIGISVINYRMRVREVNNKKSLYNADSKYEEVYGVIAKAIEDAIKEGNNSVKNNISSVVLEFRNREAANVDEDNNKIIHGTDGLGSINDELLIKHMNKEYFKQKYRAYINENLINNINNSSNGLTNLTMEVTGIDSFIEPNIDSFTFNITYTSNEKETDRVLKGTYSISVPDYTESMDIKNDVVSIQENVLWTKAITCNQNILVKGEDSVVKITGDIYAYGTDDLTTIDQSGIRIMDGKLLRVEGSIMSNAYISVDAQGATLQVNNGDIYCNTLSIPMGVKDANILVNNGDVNTFDDIELNGETSNISITGSYYGFSDGTSTITTHDKSSAIIINSPDIGKKDGSSLYISGEHKSNNMYYLRGLDDSNENSGIYVFGTMYIDLTGTNTYQSGESLAIRKNYKAYSKKLKANEDRENKFKPENIRLDSYPPLVLVKEIGKGNSNPNVMEKTDYFKFYNEDYSNELNLGIGDSINLDNVKYFLGTYISNQSLHNPIGSVEIENFRVLKDRNYGFVIKHMADKGLMNEDLITKEGSFEDAVCVNDRLDLTDNNEIKLQSMKDKSVIVLSVDKDVYISNDLNSVSGYDATKDIGIQGDVIEEGVVVTGGNIIVDGDVTYHGILVSKKDVTLKGRITLKNSYYQEFAFKRKLLGLIASQEEAINVFKNSENKGAMLHFAKNSYAKENDKYVSYKKHQDIVDIKWKRIR